MIWSQIKKKRAACILYTDTRISVTTDASPDSLAAGTQAICGCDSRSMTKDKAQNEGKKKKKFGTENEITKETAPLSRNTLGDNVVLAVNVVRFTPQQRLQPDVQLV